MRAAIAVVAGLIFVRMATQGIAATYDQQATAAALSSDADATPIAEQAWAEARTWDPLNARYPGYLGFKVFLQREGRLADAEGALREAVRLEPSSLNDATLATVLAQEHKYGDAIQTLQNGLRSEPNSLDLRLTLAQMLPPPQSTDYLRQITALEDSPVGRVRAIGNITEYKFAIADAGVADAATDPAEARRFYQRAAALLESYVDEGGTTNIQRQVLIGDHPNPALDNQMRQLMPTSWGGSSRSRPPPTGPRCKRRHRRMIRNTPKCLPKRPNRVHCKPANLFSRRYIPHGHHRHPSTQAFQRRAQAATPPGPRPRRHLRSWPGAVSGRSLRQGHRRMCFRPRPA